MQIALICGCFLLLWALWFCLAPVDLRIVSTTATVKADAVPLQALSAGRLARVMTNLGETVQEGDILLEIEADLPWLDLEHAQAARDAAEAELRQATDRLAVESQLSATRRENAETERQAAAALARLAQAQVEELRRQAEAQTHLASAGAIRLDDAQHAQALLAQAQEEADAARAQQQNAILNAQQVATEENVRLMQLKENLSALDGSFSTKEIAVSILEEQIERQRLRAPTTGMIGGMMDLQPGRMVQPEDILLTVVPTEANRVVAWFPPGEAIGRIESGQTAILRLQAFPWTRYGTVPLTVLAVGNAAETRGIAVTLSAEDSPLPLSHGMPGQVEITLSQSTPLGLSLLAAGVQP
jgi:multidrug resistance efflux pump